MNMVWRISGVHVKRELPEEKVVLPAEKAVLSQAKRDMLNKDLRF
jgi:hypothetical protein